MNRTQFVARLRALGHTTPTAAAAALGIDRTSCWRMWRGQRRISATTERLLVLLEASQPAPIGPRAARILRTATRVEAGARVHAPRVRSRYEYGYKQRMAWDDALAAGVDAGLWTVWRGRYLLTELGARCRAFLDRLAPPVSK